MTYLLDVNVLVALVDTVHVHHVPANRWFDKVGHHSWASCPITENGAWRVLLNTRYRNTTGAPALVAQLIERLFQIPRHVFWPDDFSMVSPYNRAAKIPSAALVTDVYLLMMAERQLGQLVTFDKRLAASALLDLKPALHLIED